MRYLLIVLFASIVATIGYAVWRLVLYGANSVARGSIRFPGSAIPWIVRLRWVLTLSLWSIVIWLIFENAIITAMVLLGVTCGLTYSLYAIRTVWNDLRTPHHPPTLRVP
jgi:hypothetical protein